ncbi:MAG TPA: DedA family protein, partial [Gemmatimonadetes bacterium]|nr:DedA family protein [Gemmatimonadota bacterium]
MDRLLDWLPDVSPLLMYLVLGVGAAVENIIPPIPADTFVLIGGFLADRGSANTVVVFAVTWTANVVSALVVYAAAYRYGDAFFQTRLGRSLLDRRQVGTVQKFFRRWGVAAIFYTRFLPGLRVAAPVVAGLIRQRPLPVAIPLVVASAIWYGGLVWIGAFAGRNVDQLLQLQARLNWALTLIGGAVFVVLAWWW